MEKNRPKLIEPIGHTMPIQSVAFSPKGDFVLTGSFDRTAKLWTLNGKEVHTFEGHEGGVNAVAFSPEGTQLLTGSYDKSVVLWDLETGEVLKRFQRENIPQAVYSIAFSPDGTRILSGGAKGQVNLWSIKDQKNEARENPFFGQHTDTVCGVAFAPDNNLIATASNDKSAILYDLTSDKTTTLRHKDKVKSIAFSPDSTQLVTACADGTLSLWKVADGKRIRQLKGHSKAVNCVAFSKDSLIVSGSSDRSVIIWTKKGRTYQKKILTGHKSTVKSVVFSPDGNKVFSGSSGRRAILWDPITSKEEVNFIGHSASLLAASFSPDGSEILAGSTKPFPFLWDLEQGEIRSYLTGHTKEIRSVGYSPDGSLLLTSSKDKFVNLWDATTKEKIPEDYQHKKTAYSAVIANDNSFLATGSEDDLIRIWDRAQSNPKILRGHKDEVRAIALSPDNKLILSGSVDKKVLLWDIQAKDPIPQELANNTETVRAVAFSPDGNHFASGSSDNAVIIWDTKSREKKAELKGHHQEDIYDLCFSPDSSQILTGSKDKKAILWDLEGNMLQLFEGHKSTVCTVDFSSLGPYVLTGSHDCTIKLWNTDNGAELASLIQVGTSDWVVTAPSGLFDASPGAMKLMHYVVGLEVIELDQLKERYWQPGLLKVLMKFTDDVVKDVDEFKDVPLYPTIELAKIEEETLIFKIKERTGGIGRISLRINNKERERDIRQQKVNKDGKTNFSISLKNYERFFEKGENTVSIRCWNKEGWLPGPIHELKYTPKKERRIKSSESALHTLFVGTSNYRNKNLSLNFPDQDATFLNEAVKIVGEYLFVNKVHTNLLTTEFPSSDTFSSKKNIKKAFQELAKKAQPQDVVIVYFSGHGANFDDGQKARYFYLTHDIVSSNLSDSVVRQKGAISSDELTDWINRIPARKQVLIFDTCYSGKIMDSLKSKNAIDSTRDRAIERMKDRTGLYVLTGSAADKVSYEASNYGQGLLTYTLLQGMKGAALMDRINQAEKSVDVMTLFTHSREEVERLSKEFSVIQRPTLRAPLNVESFDIGIAPENARRRIKLAMPKPVFERSNFMNKKHFLDDLDISETLDQYLSGSIGIGNRPQAIFIDVVNFPGAHNVRGLYTKTSKGYSLEGKVYKDQNELGDFKVTGKGMEDIVPKIGRKVEQITFPIDDYEIPTDEEIGIIEKGRKEDLEALKDQVGFGYNENFIGDKFKVAMPELSAGQKKDVAKSKEKETVLNYQYYSVVQSKSRKFPFFAACNLHGGEFRKLGRSGSFIRDPRLDEKYQCDDDFYRYKFQDNTDNTITYTKIFHRGHMTKREDTQWGKDDEIAVRGAKLTFFFTNAIPQHGHLNGVVWRGLEDYIMHVATDGKKATGSDIYKINIFTGPVFQKGDPRLPLKVNGRKRNLPVPVLFWKVVYFKKKSDDTLYYVGFMMGQKTLLGEAFGRYGVIARDGRVKEEKDEDFLGYKDKEVFQVKVSFIEEKTKMKFHPAKDPLKNSKNGRQISEVVKKLKRDISGEPEGLGYGLDGMKL